MYENVRMYFFPSCMYAHICAYTRAGAQEELEKIRTFVHPEGCFRVNFHVYNRMKNVFFVYGFNFTVKLFA